MRAGGPLAGFGLPSSGIGGPLACNLLAIRWSWPALFWPLPGVGLPSFPICWLVYIILSHEFLQPVRAKLSVGTVVACLTMPPKGKSKAKAKPKAKTKAAQGTAEVVPDHLCEPLPGPEDGFESAEENHYDSGRSHLDDDPRPSPRKDIVTEKEKRIALTDWPYQSQEAQRL